MAEEERKSREVAEQKVKAFETEAKVAEVRRVQEVAEAGRAAARAEEARQKREAAKFARAEARAAEAKKAQKAEEAAKAAARALEEREKFKAALAVLPAVRMAEDRPKACGLLDSMAASASIAEAEAREAAARSPAERLETIAGIAADLVTQINNLRLENAVAPAAQDEQINREADGFAKEDPEDTQPPLPPPSLPPDEPLLPAPAEPPKEDIAKQDEERKDGTECVVHLVADAAKVEEELAKEEATEAESATKEGEPGKLEAPRKEEAAAEAAEAEKEPSKQEAPPAKEDASQT